MNTHTPGPWQVIEANADDYEEGPLAIEADDAGRDVANMVHKDPGAPTAEEYANARLIAAAPELLAALRALNVPDYPLAENEANRGWILAQRAIAKAEGVAQ